MRSYQLRFFPVLARAESCMLNPSSFPLQPNFETTRWSVILHAGVDNPNARDAYERLCMAYWSPIYAYIRRRGNSHHNSVDLTQGFFAHLLEDQVLERVSPDAGRFRAYLLACVKNFMASEFRGQRTTRRGGGRRLLSIDVEQVDRQYQAQWVDRCTPEMAYERSWIETLLQEVILRLQQEHELAGKSKLFQHVQGYLVATSEKIPQAQIAEELGISVSAVAMSIYRLRQRYAQYLRESIAETLADPAEVDDELRRLIALLSDR